MPHQQHEGECYKWFKSASPFTASANRWVVLVGSDFVGSDTSTSLITVTDGVSTIDSIALSRFDRDVTAAGATTTKTLVGLWRRMLCPPRGVITDTNGGTLSLVEACCLENALSIL